MPEISLDIAPVLSAGGVIVSALAGVWGIRKLIKLVNRS